MSLNRVYTVKQMQAACFFGTPMLACFLIAKNFRVFNKSQQATNWLFIGILWTIALIALGFLIPDGPFDRLFNLLPVVNTLVIKQMIEKIQGEDIKEHFANNGEKGLNKVIVFSSIIITAIFIIPIIYFTYFDVSSDLTRKDFGNNGIYYNSEMPINEVEKLGGILNRVEYFRENNSIDVVFISNSEKYELKTITDENSLNNKANQESFKSLFKHVNEYKFNKPIVFKLVNPELTEEITISLDNYDSIPTVPEVEYFRENSNYKLYYPICFSEKERRKFQSIVLEMNQLFPKNEFIEFYILMTNNEYNLVLFVQNKVLKDTSAINEFKVLKSKLNHYDFKYSFRITLESEDSKIEL